MGELSEEERVRKNWDKYNADRAVLMARVHWHLCMAAHFALGSNSIAAKREAGFALDRIAEVEELQNVSDCR